MTPLVTPAHHWHCPNCGKEDVTHEARPHSRFHICPSMRMLSAPMVPRGTKAKVSLHEREDYINGDEVMLDPERRRPVMSIVTERDDGKQDVAVFAPTATAKGS